jgi:hypothetical protein
LNNLLISFLCHHFLRWAHHRNKRYLKSRDWITGV